MLLVLHIGILANVLVECCIEATYHIVCYAELIIMAIYQTFSGQLWHLTNEIKFDQNYYTLSNKFTKGNHMSGQFSTLISIDYV